MSHAGGTPEEKVTGTPSTADPELGQVCQAPEVINTLYVTPLPSTMPGGPS